MAFHLSPAKLFISGSVTLGFGLWQFYEKRQRLKTWVRTIGTIGNVRRDRNGDVTVRVKYQDQSGCPQACTLPFADGDRIGLGSEIEVAFNPRVPGHAFIADKKDMNLAAIVSGIVGLGLLVAGAIALKTP